MKKRDGKSKDPAEGEQARKDRSREGIFPDNDQSVQYGEKEGHMEEGKTRHA